MSAKVFFLKVAGQEDTGFPEEGGCLPHSWAKNFIPLHQPFLRKKMTLEERK